MARLSSESLGWIKVTNLPCYVVRFVVIAIARCLLVTEQIDLP